MLPDLNVKCPATGFAKACREIVAHCVCPKFVSIHGLDPQTGVLADKHGCVDSFLPMLLIENSQMTRQAGAAIESFRNEVIKADETATQERRKVLMELAELGTIRRLP